MINQITTIIPTFNRVHTLPRAIDSVIAQTFACAEIIVVDDGSTDHTRTLIEKNYPTVRYVAQKNSGVSSARNCGIRLAQTDYLAFLDSDDAWQPTKLQKQIQALKESDFLISHTNELWFLNGKQIKQAKKHRKKGGFIFSHCLPFCVISPSSVVIHRRVFDDVGVFDESLPACEDYDLWLRITAKFPVHFLEEALVIKHGGHADQLSKKYWGMDRFRIKALVNILQNNSLGGQELKLAKAVLENKIDVYLSGAVKRNKAEEVKYYKNLKTSLL